MDAAIFDSNPKPWLGLLSQEGIVSNQQHGSLHGQLLDDSHNSINAVGIESVHAFIKEKRSGMFSFSRRGHLGQSHQEGDINPASLDAMNNLAGILQTQGRAKDAAALYRKFLESLRYEAAKPAGT